MSKMVRDAIMHVIKQNGPTKSSEFYSKIDVAESDHQIRNSLHKLKSNGVLAQTGDGAYFILDESRTEEIPTRAARAKIKTSEPVKPKQKKQTKPKKSAETSRSDRAFRCALTNDKCLLLIVGEQLTELTQTETDKLLDYLAGRVG